jgi:hypothetical protein
MPRRRVVASRSALSLACLTSALLALAACRSAPDTAGRSAPAAAGQEVLAVVDRLQPGGRGAEASASTAVGLTVTFPEDLAGVKLGAHYDPRGNLLPGHALADGDMLRLTLPPPDQRGDFDLHDANVRLAQ